MRVSNTPTSVSRPYPFEEPRGPRVAPFQQKIADFDFSEKPDPYYRNSATSPRSPLYPIEERVAGRHHSLSRQDTLDNEFPLPNTSYLTLSESRRPTKAKSGHDAATLEIPRPSSSLSRSQTISSISSSSLNVVRSQDGTSTHKIREKPESQATKKKPTRFSFFKRKDEGQGQKNPDVTDAFRLSLNNRPSVSLPVLEHSTSSFSPPSWQGTFGQHPAHLSSSSLGSLSNPLYVTGSREPSPISTHQRSFSTDSLNDNSNPKYISVVPPRRPSHDSRDLSPKSLTSTLHNSSSPATTNENLTPTFTASSYNLNGTSHGSHVGVDNLNPEHSQRQDIDLMISELRKSTDVKLKTVPGSGRKSHRGALEDTTKSTTKEHLQLRVAELETQKTLLKGALQHLKLSYSLKFDELEKENRSLNSKLHKCNAILEANERGSRPNTVISEERIGLDLRLKID